MSVHLPSDLGVAAPISGWNETEVSVRLSRGAGGIVRVDGVLCSAPVWFRWDGATLWMVGSGASPVGEDRVRVRVDVGPGVEVEMRSVAATVVYAARGPGTRWDTDIHVAAGAVLRWRPEPVILTERARHVAVTTVHAAAGATVTLDEVLVLGRTGDATGALRSTLDVRIDESPALLTSIDTALPGWSGPGGVDGAGVVAHRLQVAEQPVPTPVGGPRNAALLQPNGTCRLAVATARDVAEARQSIDSVLPD